MSKHKIFIPPEHFNKEFKEKFQNHFEPERAHAELCPVCRGSGWVLNDGSTKDSNPYRKKCHGCSGVGWVTVHDTVRYYNFLVWED